jgi:hypothetical protein
MFTLEERRQGLKKRVNVMSDISICGFSSPLRRLIADSFNLKSDNRLHTSRPIESENGRGQHILI